MSKTFLWLTGLDYVSGATGQLIYTRGLVDGLRELGCRVDVIGLSPDGAFVREHGAAGRDTFFRAPTRRRIASLLSSLYSHAYVLQSDELAVEAMGRLDQDYSLIVIDYLAMGWLLDTKFFEVARRDAPKSSIAYLSHNHEASVRRSVAASVRRPGAKKLAMMWDAIKAARLERRFERSVDVVTANSADDAAKFRASGDSQNVVVVSPGYAGPRSPTRTITAEMPRRVCMMGSLEWVAKSDSFLRFAAAAATVLPSHGIEVHVAGQIPDGVRAALSKYNSFIKVHGFVQSEAEFLCDCRLGLIHDDVGGGFKHRLLLYVFNRVPVVAIRSQVTELPAIASECFYLGNDASELVRCIVDSIDRIDELNAKARIAYDVCDGEYDWRVRAAELVSVAATRQSSR
ncbi:MAG: hypothetical protein RIS35_2381 [Pseudomonadota bacterium]